MCGSVGPHAGRADDFRPLGNLAADVRRGLRRIAADRIGAEIEKPFLYVIRGERLDELSWYSLAITGFGVVVAVTIVYQLLETS